MGVPPHHQDGYIPPLPSAGWRYSRSIRKDGVACNQEWWGYPPPHQPDGVPPLAEWGTLPPPSEQKDSCENITSRHPSDSGGNEIQ